MRECWQLLHAHSDSASSLLPTQWRKLEPLLADHHLEGLVFKNHFEYLPAELKRKFAHQWKAQWLRNHLYLNELRNVQASARDYGLSFTVLKGAALLQELYSDLGSRQMSDIDLLIPVDEVDRFQTMLMSLGFKKIKSKAWRANDFKETFTITRNSFELVFELHTRLFYLETSDIQWQVTDTSPQTLNPTDNLIHLLGHLSYQHTFLKLFWLVDIDRHIRHYGREINWRRVDEISEKLRMQRAVHSTLWAAHSFLKTPVPEKMYSELSWIHRRLLTEKFLWQKKFTLRYYLLKYALRDSANDALMYAFFWMLQKTKFGLMRR